MTEQNIPNLNLKLVDKQKIINGDLDLKNKVERANKLIKTQKKNLFELRRIDKKK